MVKHTHESIYNQKKTISYDGYFKSFQNSPSRVNSFTLFELEILFSKTHSPFKKSELRFVKYSLAEFLVRNFLLNLMFIHLFAP